MVYFNRNVDICKFSDNCRLFDFILAHNYRNIFGGSLGIRQETE